MKTEQLHDKTKNLGLHLQHKETRNIEDSKIQAGGKRPQVATRLALPVSVREGADRQRPKKAWKLQATGDSGQDREEFCPTQEQLSAKGVTKTRELEPAGPGECPLTPHSSCPLWAPHRGETAESEIKTVQHKDSSGEEGGGADETGWDCRGGSSQAVGRKVE